MMPSAKGKRPLRHLTACDKINAIQRIHDGESKASVARDIGVPESTLRGWCKNEEKLRYMSNNAGSDNKLTVDKLAEKMTDDSALAAGMFGGPPEKRAKLDNSLNFVSNGKQKYEDMNFKSRNSIGAIDFSNSDKGLGALHYNGLGSNNYTGYKTSPDLSSNGRNKCEESMLRGYGADVKPSDPTKSELSMAAISPLTSLSHLSGMSNIGQSPLALSFNEIASNLNLIAQLNNQSNLATVAGLNNSQNNGLRTVRPKGTSQGGLSVKSLTKMQHKSPAMDNIGMGVDMIDKPKKPSAALLSRDVPPGGALWYWIKHQQMIGLNSIYNKSLQSPSSPNRSTPPGQQKSQTMMPSTTTSSTPPPLSLTPQTNSSTPTSDDTKNSAWFWQWCKYNQLGSAMMNNKNCNDNRDNSKQIYDNILFSHLTKDMKEYSDSPSPSNSNINNNANTPEDLSKPNRSSPITPVQSIKMEMESEMNDTAISPSISPIPDQPEELSERQAALDNILYNNNNNNVVVKNESDSELNVASEGVQYGEKFLKWLESYSDPTITALDFLQFRTLLSKLRKSAERINNPVLESSKIRRRK